MHLGAFDRHYYSKDHKFHNNILVLTFVKIARFCLDLFCQDKFTHNLEDTYETNNVTKLESRVNLEIQMP